MAPAPVTAPVASRNVPNDATLLTTNNFLRDILTTSSEARDATEQLLALYPLPPLSDDKLQTDDEAKKAHLAHSRAQKTLNAHLSQLRAQNRKLAHLVRNTKSETATRRAEVDTLHLQLQNYYYESRHLAGEIRACETYPHKYIDLPLIPEDEFLDLVDGAREMDEDSLMRARIEHERAEREKLEEKRKALVMRKMELVKENAKRKGDLEALDRDLEAFINAAKPIQQRFEKEY